MINQHMTVIWKTILFFQIISLYPYMEDIEQCSSISWVRIDLEASFCIRFGSTGSNLPTSISQKAVCAESCVDYEVAAAQCNVVLRTHMEDMEQCYSISWVNIAFTSQLLDQIWPNCFKFANKCQPKRSVWCAKPCEP